MVGGKRVEKGGEENGRSSAAVVGQGPLRSPCQLLGGTFSGSREIALLLSILDTAI